MVTICTTSLTFSNSPFCPHSVFMCFVWISEQTAIIPLYNINWLVFITQTQCVYFAVRTGSLYVIQANWPVFSPSPLRAYSLRTMSHSDRRFAESICYPVSIAFSYTLQPASRVATLLLFMAMQIFPAVTDAHTSHSIAKMSLLADFVDSTD